MRIKKLLDSVYRRPLFLLYGCEPDEANRYLSKKYNLTKPVVKTGNVGQSFTLEQGNIAHHFVYLRGKDFKKVRPGIIVHELLHMVLAVMDYVGVKGGEASEEAVAYYLESLFDQVFYHVKNDKLCKSPSTKPFTRRR